jgi:hypothetical protein
MSAAWLPWAGIASILIAIIGGVFMFKVNRAQALQLEEAARSTAKSTALAEADKMIEYANLRYAALRDDYVRCNRRLNSAVEATDAVIGAVDILLTNAAPTGEGDEAYSVVVTKSEINMIRELTRDARRALLHQPE